MLVTKFIQYLPFFFFFMANKLIKHVSNIYLVDFYNLLNQPKKEKSKLVSFIIIFVNQILDNFD